MVEQCCPHAAACCLKDVSAHPCAFFGVGIIGISARGGTTGVGRRLPSVAGLRVLKGHHQLGAPFDRLCALIPLTLTLSTHQSLAWQEEQR